MDPGNTCRDNSHCVATVSFPSCAEPADMENEVYTEDVSQVREGLTPVAPPENLSIERPTETCRSLRTIARWLNEEWGREQGYSYDDTLSWCRSLAADECETIISARLVEKPVGVAVLVTCDLPSHSHLSPWLSSLYVLPKYRRAGVGGLLTSRLCETAANLGHQQIFLYVLDGPLVSFYGRLGWSLVEHVSVARRNFSIMRKAL